MFRPIPDPARAARRLTPRWRVLALALLIPAFAAAQSAEEDRVGGARFEQAPEGVIYSEGERDYIEEVIRVERPESHSEPRPLARLRGLDKISGRVSDIEAKVGDPVAYERLTILVEQCRAPAADEGEDAYAFMRIRDERAEGAVVFSGWMFASSPALSAMDHQRYDVWVLSCATS